MIELVSLSGLILFLGFCVKAGTWPVHLWLPYARSEAPTPVGALMSGVLVKVAIYGMLRLIVMGDRNIICGFGRPQFVATNQISSSLMPGLLMICSILLGLFVGPQMWIK